MMWQVQFLHPLLSGEKMSKREKVHKLFREKNGLEEPCFLEVVEYTDGAIAFVGDKFSEMFVYAYPKQVKQIKKILNEADKK